MQRTAFIICLVTTPCVVYSQKPFDNGKVEVSLQDKMLIEASGMAPSYNFPGHIWVHNDSGNQPDLMLFDAETGVMRSRIILDGLINRDWEDMDIGPGPDGTPHIYIGEIGDNQRQYERKYIYYFPEP